GESTPSAGQGCVRPRPRSTSAERSATSGRNIGGNRDQLHGFCVSEDPRLMTRTGGYLRRFAGTVMGVGVAGLAAPAWAHAPQDLPDLSRLSLEELAQIEVTSVSRRPEPVSAAAAAIYV